MKILHVIHSLSPTGGGPGEHVKQLSRTLIEKGHTSEVASLDSPNAPYITYMPLRVNALGPGMSGYGYSGHLVPWLKENAAGYDSVIIHGIWQYSSFGVWLALRKTNTPYFIFPHGMLDPWFKQRHPFKHLKKSFYWFWSEYKVLRDAKAVLFTCEQERALARQSFWPYKVKEEVVGCGTVPPPLEKGNARELFLNKYPHLRNRRLLLFLGRIHPKKGCELVIKAFMKIAKRNSDMHLVMAGPDQIGWQKKLRRLCKRFNIDSNVTWTGLLSGDLKWAAFNAADVFILPSHQESFGIAVTEALSCGVPVLISNKVNIWREIEKDKAGFVASDNLQGVVVLLERWLNLPDNEKDTMRKRAEECFLRRFTIQKAAQNLIAILQKQ